jgi:hypothetical protein
MSTEADSKTCPEHVVECICLEEGADPDLHGKRPVKCEACGGSTGMHTIGCPKRDTRLVFGPLVPRSK